MGFLDIAGGLAGGIPGFLAGSVADGGSLTDTLGINDSFRAQNPYAPDVLQDEMNKQAQIYAQQQTLAQALQQQMAGQGPNPAQTQFQMNQGANIANAQGLIASQRGLNPALAARMGANQATAANNHAALSSALLQQQQQLGATSALGGLYGQMQSGNLGQQQLYNQANMGAQQINAGVSAGNTNRNAQLIGGVLQAGGSAGAAMLSHGGRVPGQAMVSGDSKANDTVDAKLSPDEIVIPRSMSHDPEKAKEFIDHLLKGEKKKGGDYGDVLKARRKKRSAA